MNRYERINYDELERIAAFYGGADDDAKDGGIDRGASTPTVELICFIIYSAMGISYIASALVCDQPTEKKK